MLITHIWDLIQSSFLGALYAWAHLMHNNSKSYSNIPFHFTKCFHNKCPKKESENERFRGRGLPKTQTVNAHVLDLKNYTWSLCTAWMEINRHVSLY